MCESTTTTTTTTLDLLSIPLLIYEVGGVRVSAELATRYKIVGDKRGEMDRLFSD